MTVVASNIQKSIFDLMKNANETDPDKAMKKFADGLGSIIADAIKTGTVNVSINIPVVGVAGSIPVTGTASGAATGTIS